MSSLNSIIRRIKYEDFTRRLSERLWLFFFVFLAQVRVLLSYLPYQLEASSEELFSLVQAQLLRIGGVASVFTLLFALLTKKWLTRTFGAFVSLIVLLSSAYELYLLDLYHVTYNTDLAEIMLSTNWREGGEFLDSITATQVMHVVRMLLPSIACAFVVSRLSSRLPSIVRLCSSFVMTLLIVFGLMGTLYDDLMRCVRLKNFSGLYYSGIERIFYNTVSAYRTIRFVAAEQEKMRSSQNPLNGLSVTPISQKPLTVVLILGESARRSSMHCYGYSLQNTPYADSLIRNQELIPFTEVVSPASATIQSNTRSLTFFTHEEGERPWYQYPSIMHVLRQAGYATVWIANQEITGEYSMSNLFGRQADILTGNPSFFKGIAGERVANRTDLYDEAILPLLQHYQSLPDSLRKNSPLGLFQIVHLMGSHFTYRERYPKAFDKFTPDSLPVRKGEAKDKIIAAYANSLLYTDYIIHEIIQSYREENALVIYLSDHGDALFDEDHPDLMGHALLPRAVEIPLFVYFSPQLRKERPDLWKQIYGQRNKRILTDLLTHSLVDLLGIRTEYTQPRFNFFSPTYDEQRKRIVVAPIANKKLVM